MREVEQSACHPLRRTVNIAFYENNFPENESGHFKHPLCPDYITGTSLSSLAAANNAGICKS